jgi:hypothetical protein
MKRPKRRLGRRRRVMRVLTMVRKTQLKEIMLYKTFVVLALIFIGLELLATRSQISELTTYAYRTSLGQQLNTIQQTLNKLAFDLDWPPPEDSPPNPLIGQTRPKA